MTRMTPEQEHALVVRAQDGDAQAFAALYQAYWRRVWAQIKRLMGPRPEVEDVVQEVFVQLHRSLPNFRADSAFSTWVYRIAWNTGVSHLRKRQLKTVELPALRQFACDKEQWAKIEARDKLRTLYAALDELPEDQRQAFILFEIEGKSLKDIAHTLDASLNTVASRVRRSRERLRDLLESAEGAQRPFAQGAMR